MSTESDMPAEDTVGPYRPPAVCDVDAADDREFHVVAGPTPPSEAPRN